MPPKATGLPHAQFQLQHMAASGEAAGHITDLKRSIAHLSGTDDVEVEAESHTTVVASVPARNQREADRLRKLMSQKLKGWKLLTPQRYKVPRTF